MKALSLTTMSLAVLGLSLVAGTNVATAASRRPRPAISTSASPTMATAASARARPATCRRARTAAGTSASPTTATAASFPARSASSAELDMPARSSPTAQASRPPGQHEEDRNPRPRPNAPRVGPLFFQVCRPGDPLPVRHAGNGQRRGRRAPSVLQDKVDAAAQMLKHDKRLGPLSDAARARPLCFIVGNMLFVLLHEIGHVLITELGLPVLGARRTPRTPMRPSPFSR